jgi:nucleoside-diphosphate-sugar epimerase
MMRLLVTGASGKVGTNFLKAFSQTPRFKGWQVRAIAHNRPVNHPGVETVTGSLSDADFIAQSMQDVTHVLHMAAVKESPDLAMDVGVKGMFNLMEAFRSTPGTKQFILIGGDCSVGHMFQEYDGPVTEAAPRRAYPGCYALTKVIEEVMLEQYRIQYGSNTCCLRAPWIMEKDDFRYAMAFRDQFGGPDWHDFFSDAELDALAAKKAVPLMYDRDGNPLRRNFVHVSDLAQAILAALDNPVAEGQLYNIAMDEPVDYGRMAAYLAKTRGYEAIEIRTDFISNWLSNAKARLELGWRPEVDLEAQIDRAWDYERAADDPRKIWYPG